MKGFFRVKHSHALALSLFLIAFLSIIFRYLELYIPSNNPALYLFSELLSAFVSIVTGATMLTYFYASGNRFLFLSATALFTNGLGVFIYAIILWWQYSYGVQIALETLGSGVFTGQFILALLTFIAVVTPAQPKSRIKPVEDNRRAIRYIFLFIALVTVVITLITIPIFFDNLLDTLIVLKVMGYLSAFFFISSFLTIVKGYLYRDASPLVWGSMTGIGIHSAGYLIQVMFHYNASEMLIPSISFRITGFGIALIAFILQKLVLMKRLYLQRNQLRDSRKMLKQVLDTIPIAVFWKDRDLNYQGCNRRFAKDAGLSNPEEIIGKSDYQLCWVDTAEMYRQDDMEVINSGEPKLGYEEPLGKQEDATEWLKTSKIPLTDQQGNVSGILGTYENITQKKQAHIKLKKYTEDLEVLNWELKQKNKELDEFVFIASHDLQEPLRKVVAFSDLLKKDAGEKLPEMASRDLDFITESVHRMSRLLTDLLKYSRSNSKELNFTRISFEKIVKEAMDNLSTRIEKTGAVIKYGDLPVISCDPTFMLQVVQNILSNGIKYNKREPIIEIKVIEEEGFYRFKIKDNGIGIKREYIEQIFSPFRRLHGKQEYEGSGIGLSICKKVIRRHGGEIHAESEIDKGSLFVFTLPTN